MATYETGTATGPADLIGKLATFAGTLGWTVAAQTTSASTGLPAGATSVTGRVFSKGTLVFGIGYDTDDVWLCGATGVNGANNWAAQTGTSATSTSGYMPRSNEMSGPYQAYHFFGGTSPDYLHVVVERSAGIFKHFAVGELIKAGSYTGGAYLQAVNWYMTTISSNYYANAPEDGSHRCLFDSASGNTYNASYANLVRADIDSKSNNWMPMFNTWQGNYSRGDFRRNGLSYHANVYAPNNFNQLTPLQPFVIMADRPSSLHSIVGHPADIRGVNMTNFAPGELLTIGSDEWLVFPAIQKTATWGTINATAAAQIPSSGPYGYAYKRN